MKLFVAVVMFVMVSVVFAAEDSPRPTPSIEEAKQKIEEAQLDKAKTQENQPAVRVIEIKPAASQGNADYKTDEEKTDPDKPGDYTLLLSVLTAIFTGALVITGALQYCVYKAQAKIMRRQLKAARLSAKAAQESAAAAVKSAEAAKASVEVADRGLKIANRAYLFVEGWMDPNLREDAPATVSCRLYNTGHTPATLKKRCIYRVISAEKPQPLTPACLNDMEQIALPINAQGATFVSGKTAHIGTVEYRALKERTSFLYASVCFAYGDVFDKEYWVVSSAVYDMERRVFSAIEGSEYNCHGIYREKDWVEQSQH